MYVENYAKAKGKLRYWNELLQEWVFMVHRIYRISKKRSAVYAEKERANTGLLAAAAIKNGWVALEESITKKYDKDIGKETYRGRCDLVLWRDQKHHEIEAKFIRHVLFSKNRDRIDRVYNRAISDSYRSTFDGLRSEKKIAITYVVPVINPTRLEKSTDLEIKHEISGLIKDIKTEYRPLLLSYGFPGPIDMEGTKRKALGVILFGEITA
jgi:hypothetical protein